LQSQYCPGPSRKVIYKVGPIFPKKFLSTGLPEGWVLVAYDVSPEGSTENIKVIDSSPRGYLERAAIDAASLFKYESDAGSSLDCNLFTWQLEK